MTYYETNNTPQYPGALGDHKVYVIWQAWDNHHYIARVILDASLQPSQSFPDRLVNDMNLLAGESDVNIVGIHGQPSCGAPIDQVMAVWPAAPTDPTKCVSGNPARSPSNPGGIPPGGQFWKTKFANVWTNSGGAVGRR